MRWEVERKRAGARRPESRLAGVHEVSLSLRLRVLRGYTELRAIGTSLGIL